MTEPKPIDEQMYADAEKLLARVDAGLMTREEAVLILTAAYGDQVQHEDTP